MKALGAILAAVIIPIAILNLLGGIAGGIWLAILGEWSAIFTGLAVFFLGSFLVSLLLLPGIAVAGLGAGAIGRGNPLVGGFFLLLSSPWTYLVIAAWELALFTYFAARFTPTNIIPMWLWSYAAATGVWSFLASREERSGEGGSASLAAFAAQVAYIVLSVCVMWLGWGLRSAVFAMMIPLILTLALGLIGAGLVALAGRR